MPPGHLAKAIQPIVTPAALSAQGVYQESPLFWHRGGDTPAKHSQVKGLWKQQAGKSCFSRDTSPKGSASEGLSCPSHSSLGDRGLQLSTSREQLPYQSSSHFPARIHQTYF